MALAKKGFGRISSGPQRHFTQNTEEYLIRRFGVNITSYKMKTTEPNQAPEPTTTAVTDRAPSSTLRASCGRGSSWTFGKKMKSRHLSLFLWLLSCILILIAVGIASGAKKDPVYGAKSASTISVRITGGGVQSPGVYNIQAGATLHDLIANDKAVWLKSSTGRFRIYREANSKKITIEKDYTQWDFKLLDGDDIYAESMGDMKQPQTQKWKPRSRTKRQRQDTCLSRWLLRTHRAKHVSVSSKTFGKIKKWNS